LCPSEKIRVVDRIAVLRFSPGTLVRFREIVTGGFEPPNAPTTTPDVGLYARLWFRGKRIHQKLGGAEGSKPMELAMGKAVWLTEHTDNAERIGKIRMKFMVRTFREVARVAEPKAEIFQ
jgi:hypothetical protein